MKKKEMEKQLLEARKIILAAAFTVQGKPMMKAIQNFMKATNKIEKQ